MSESHISAGATEKLPGWDKLHAKTMACPTTLKDMLKKVCGKVLRTGEKVGRTTLIIFQSLLGWSPIQEGRFGISWGTIRSLITNVFFYVCFLHELVDQTFHVQWTNLLHPAQNGHKLVIDDWQDWYHTFITEETVVTVAMLEMQHNVVDGLISRLRPCWWLWALKKSTSGGILCIIGCRTFVSFCWMCKKQTSVYHSSTESEITSLDAGLRTDGLLAFDLWDVMLDVLRSANNAKTLTKPGFGNRFETGACSFNPSKTEPQGNRDCQRLS